MEQLTVTLTPAMLALIPIVAAILQVAKRIPLLDSVKSYFPFLAMGIAYGVIYLSEGGAEGNPIMTAVVVGLIASGAYDAIRLPAKEVKKVLTNET